MASRPNPKSPESDSTRLGGRASPWLNSQESRESNGKHRLALVEIFIVDGIDELSKVEISGAIETGISGSISLTIRPGDHDWGSFLSPREINREKRSLAKTSLPIGRSVIGSRATRFA